MRTTGWPIRRLLIPVIALALCPACGTSNDTPSATAPALQALTWNALASGLSPLAVDDTKSYTLESGSDLGLEDGVEYFERPGGEFRVVDQRPATETDFVIDTGLERVADMDISLTQQGTIILLACGYMMDAQGLPVGALRVYADANQNGRIDTDELAHSLVDADAHSTVGSAWTRIFRLDSSNVLFLDPLDHRVRRATDTTQDGLPDTLATADWLNSTQTHALDGIRGLREGSEGGVSLIYRGRGEAPGPGESVVCVRDSDGDGVADDTATATMPYWPVGVPPAIEDRPSDLDTAALVGGPAGAVLEVWSMDPQDNPLTLLGSATVGGSTGRVLVPLSGPQSIGTRMAPTVAGSGIFGETHVVAVARPFIYGVSPGIVDPTNSTTLTVAGKAFTASCSWYLTPAIPVDDPVVPTSTFVSSTQMTVVVPSMPGVEGTWTLQVRDGLGVAHATSITLRP